MTKTIKKIYLAIAIVLSGITTSVAQTVTVPSNCTVVSTDTTLGGVLGAGGKVTSGGVVTMADGGTPNGGTFTFAGPAGSVLAPVTTWKLSGDLSSSTTTPNYNSPTQPANGTSATIISYNKTLRPSENASTAFPLNNPTWARSKGRVSVGYSIVSGTFSCGNSMSFEIFKTFTASPITNVPKIVGPDCIEGGKQCTFSVDQVASDNASDAIGFDQYYWTGIPTLASGTSLYFSADYSSVTFTPATSGSIILKCCIGRANPWDGGFLPIIQPIQSTTGTTCVTKTVGAAPSQPTFTTNPNGLCVQTGATTTFTINYTSTNTCTWTMANTGWTIQSQTASSVTIKTNGFNNPGVLTLSVSNGTCTPLTFQYQINRSFTAPVTIAPVIANNTCLASGSTNNMFAISTSASANPTTWSVTSPSGVTPAPGITLGLQTPNSTVAVNVLSTAVVGLYTLTAKSTSCAGNITTQFRVKPKVPTITGNACVIKGALTPQTYNCVASTGATYTWVFPAGWQPTTGTFVTTTNSISVTPSSATAVLNGNATVTANGVVISGVPDCNNISANFAINYASVAPTNVVAGCFSVGLAGNGSVTYSNPVGSGSYYGTLTATGSSVNSITGTAVSLTIASVLTNVGVLLNSTVSGTLSFSTSALVAGTYNLKIYHNSGCGNAVFSTTSITITGNGTTLSPNPGVTQDNYFAIAPATMVNPQYEWTTCTSAGVCTPVGTNSPLLALSGASAPPAGNQVCVNVFPLGSTCKTRLCTAQGTHSKMASTVIKGESIEGISIYPNPNSGNFNIKVIDFKQEATASLYDYSGKKIKDFNLTKGENQIKNDELAQGNYFVVLSIDGKTDVKQIIIK